MEVAVEIPHSLGAKVAAARLQSLDDLTMRKCVVESDGKVEGQDARSITTITDGKVTIALTVDAPWWWPKWIVEKRARTRVENALKGT